MTEPWYTRVSTMEVSSLELESDDEQTSESEESEDEQPEQQENEAMTISQTSTITPANEAKSFPKFSWLPTDIQMMIWESALDYIPSRVIEFKQLPRKSTDHRTLATRYVN
ncbi:hypothetical protein DID88_007636 [Monilinia fructigena]|uniref:2EXR domain-containing protein n=1 Tax=Monilinia fructigena TaxID=38457 RepID=A0A395J410_9HELO|nr:hypothetical protein DID88_007636 [Monilinia fructigena]